MLYLRWKGFPAFVTRADRNNELETAEVGRICVEIWSNYDVTFIVLG
jgi:hypothetical protein